MLKKAVVTLAVGPVGDNLVQVSGAIFAAYASRVGSEYHCIRIPTSEYPEGEKFRLKQLLESTYDRVIFFDADVVLTQEAPDLFEVVPADKLGMHDDLGIDPETGHPHLPQRKWLGLEYLNLYESQDWPWPLPETCYNTGVIVASRAHALAFTAPEKPYTRTHTVEQSIVNANIKRLGIPMFQLPTEFNAQWWMSRGYKGFDHVYHYAGTTRQLGNRATIMRHKARELGHDMPAEAPAMFPVAPKEGPGTELKALFIILGFASSMACGCEALAALMNHWGIEGCVKNRDRIIERLRKNQAKVGWFDKVSAAVLAMAAAAKGDMLIAKLNPADPAPGLVDEAIRRYAAKLQASQPSPPPV